MSRASFLARRGPQATLGNRLIIVLVFRMTHMLGQAAAYLDTLTTNEFL